MTTDKEHIEIVLTARSYLYQILHAIFASEPDKELLAGVSGDIPRDVIGLLFGDEASEVKAFYKCLECVEKSLSGGESDYVENLRSEYTRMFIGPAKLAAPPWESLHTTQERTLFHKVTLEVRRAYSKSGYLPAEYPRVADDHIAIELNFMYNLAMKSLELYSLEKSDEASVVITDQKNFLSEHLLLWSDKYASALEAAEPHSLYTVTARYMDFFLKADRVLLDELAENLIAAS